MAYSDQAAVDAAFADLDSLLEARTAPVGCELCGSRNLARSANDGTGIHYCNVCCDCGAVQTQSFGVVDEHYFPLRKISSNYKRIHHWHERISQLMLDESRIPDDKFLQIAERICDGSHAVINKDVIRGVLRSLNMQLFIEKWLQIIQRITLIEPPKPGGQLLMRLDEMFQELQVPFANFKADKRKNFLNYNYVFCRLFQQLECPQFSMFFPLIKSRQKLRALDQMWEQMMVYLKWPVTPLQSVPSFAVKLEQPAHLLQRIKLQVASAAPAATHTMPVKTGFRKSDLNLLRELDRRTAQARRHSALPVRAPQKFALKARHLPYASAAELRPLRQWRPQRRPV
jgi:hypothetical protein